MYLLPDESGKIIARFGGTIEFPTFISVDEKYSDAGTYINADGVDVSAELNGGISPYTTPGGDNNYDVTTPFKFGFGASGGISILTVAAISNTSIGLNYNSAPRLHKLCLLILLTV